MTTPTPPQFPSEAYRASHPDDDASEPREPAGPSLRDLATEEHDQAEAGVPGQVIRVVMEDGTEFAVQTKNKDYVRWDKTPPARRGGVKNFSEAPFIFTSFLGWAAARRLEVPAAAGLTFDQFLELADEVERREATEVPPTH